MFIHLNLLIAKALDHKDSGFTDMRSAKLAQLNEENSQEVKPYIELANKLWGRADYVLQPLCFFNSVTWETKCTTLKNLHAQTTERKGESAEAEEISNLTKLAQLTLPKIYNEDSQNPKIEDLRRFLKDSIDLDATKIDSLTDTNLAAIGQSFLDINEDSMKLAVTDPESDLVHVGRVLQTLFPVPEKHAESTEEESLVAKLNKTRVHPLIKMGSEKLPSGIWTPQEVCFVNVNTQMERCIKFDLISEYLIFKDSEAYNKIQDSVENAQDYHYNDMESPRVGESYDMHREAFARLSKMSPDKLEGNTYYQWLLKRFEPHTSHSRNKSYSHYYGEPEIVEHNFHYPNRRENKAPTPCSLRRNRVIY